MAKSKDEKAQDIDDILGLDAEDEVSEAYQDDDYDDFVSGTDDDNLDDYLDEDIAIGTSAINEADEVKNKNGKFFVKEEYKSPLYVIPATYRFTPEEYSSEAIKKAMAEDRNAGIRLLLEAKANVLSVVTLQELDFLEAEVKAFNDATGDGVQNLYKSPLFMISNNPKEEINWLSTKSKDWIVENAKPNRNIVNTYNNQNTPKAVYDRERTTFIVIDSIGAWRTVQLNFNTKKSLQNSLVFKKIENGEILNDSTTEWFGKPVKLEYTSGVWNAQILSEFNDKFSQAQIDLAGTKASEFGFDHTNMFAFGMPKSAKARRLVLDFMGLTDLYLKETGQKA